MNYLPFTAMVFAREVHALQRRKYTNNPYIDHLAEVAGVVSTVSASHPDAQVSMAVSWLHDCVDDQQVSAQELVDRLGLEVVRGVMLLSDIEEGNRATRKAAALVRLGSAPAWVQDIKVADILSNTSSIALHDPKFALIYLEEKRLQLDALALANPELLAIARLQVADAYASIRDCRPQTPSAYRSGG